MFFTARTKVPPRRAEAFRFVNPGPLVDRELELVTPAVRWVGAMLRSAGPSASQVGPEMEESGTRRPARPLSRRHLLEVIGAAPYGREPGDGLTGRPPTYHFWFRVRRGTSLRQSLFGGLGAWEGESRGAAARPAVEMAGSLSLRIGRGEDLERYLGHLGYGVFPRARGYRYAERACRLVLPLARAHGLDELWITVNPDNLASRRTCERLGAECVETVTLPPGHPLYERGERQKCRYRWVL